MNWTREELFAKLDDAGRLFQSDGHHLYLKAESTGITRYANNEITDNQFYADATLTLRAYRGNRIGVATINQLDPESIHRGVERAEQIAQQAPEDPEFVGPPQEQTFPEVAGFDEATAQTSPAERVRLAASFVTDCRRRDLTAAGYLVTTEQIAATSSSAGAPGFHRGTTAEFSMTAKTADGSGSGWVLRWAHTLSDLDIPALAEVAMGKAVASQHPADLSPGRYTVVLEPVAAEFLLYNLTHHLDARQAEEGRSFLARFDDAGRPAGTRQGEQVFSPLFTLTRQVGHPRLHAPPFDENGVALRDLKLVNRGVVENLSHDRYWAGRKGVRPTGSLSGLGMAGSNRPTRELIKGVQDGILVTRLWYIRNVDAMKSAVTGMTRDGTFRIEGGEVGGPVKNFRFNEELRRVFRDMSAVGTPQRFYYFLSPAIVVPDFNFTSTTDSI